jgi:hypothetical protein
MPGLPLRVRIVLDPQVDASLREHVGADEFDTIFRRTACCPTFPSEGEERRDGRDEGPLAMSTPEDPRHVHEAPAPDQRQRGSAIPVNVTR